MSLSSGAAPDVAVLTLGDNFVIPLPHSLEQELWDIGLSCLPDCPREGIEEC